MFLLFYRIYRTFAVDSLICFAILMFTLYSLFQPRPAFLWMKNWMYVLAGIISFFLLFQGILFLVLSQEKLIFSHPSHFLYFFVCQTGLALAWACLALEGSSFSKLLYVLFFVAAMQMYRGVCAPLYIREAEMRPEIYAALDLLTAIGLYLFLGFLSYLFRQSRIHGDFPLVLTSRIAMLYIPLSLLAVVMLPAFFPETDISSPVILLVLSDLPVVYYVFACYVRHVETQRHLDAVLAKAAADESSYRKTMALREAIRQERHELKNRYFRLQVFLKEGKLSELSQELDSILGAAEDRLHYAETGHTYLDYLLQQKEVLAKQAGIPFRTEVLIDRDVFFDETAAGTVLSNLLDNAIEAEQQEAEPDITLTLSCMQGYLHGRVSNRVNRNILKVNPQLKTTKTDEESHGYGIRVVQKTLREHNGMIQFKMENDHFVAEFLLPLSQ